MDGPVGSGVTITMLEIADACRRLMPIFRLSEGEVRSICMEPDAESSVSISHDVAFTVTEKVLGGSRFLAIVDHASGRASAVLRVLVRVPKALRAHDTPIETLAALCDAYATPRTSSASRRHAVDGFRP